MAFLDPSPYAQNVSVTICDHIDSLFTIQIKTAPPTIRECQLTIYPLIAWPFDRGCFVGHKGDYYLLR